MFPRIVTILGWLRRLAASRSNLLIENLALRQQLAILTAKRPRPRMGTADRFFWLTLRRFRPRWKEALVVIRPDTVVCWHRAGFRNFWTWKSRRRFIGRPSTKAEFRPQQGFEPRTRRLTAGRSQQNARARRFQRGGRPNRRPRLISPATAGQAGPHHSATCRRSPPQPPAPAATRRALRPRPEPAQRPDTGTPKRTRGWVQAKET